MATPQLSYQLNPSPEPLMASPATGGSNQSVLTLTASNTTTSDVTLKYLRLDLPLGSGATDLLDLLTLDALQAAVSVTPDPAWTLFQTDVWTDDTGQIWASYLFHPEGNGTLPADNSWTFTWQGAAPTYWGVPINTVPGGPVACQVVEGSAGAPIQPLPLTKAPAGWFEPTLVAAPVTVASGTAVQLSWNGPAGASYQLNGLAAGVPAPLPNAGTFPSLPLIQDTTFTLEVTYSPPQGPDQQAAPQQVVAVLPAINSFTGQVTWPGGQPHLLLSWDVAPTNATVALSGNPNSLNPNASLLLVPTIDQPLCTTYTLTATNAAGQSAQAELVATFQPVAASPVAAGSAPLAVAFTSDGSQVWVPDYNDTVTVLDTATCQPVAASPIAVGSGADAVAFTPDGSQAWVTLVNESSVTVLDTTTYLPIAASPIAVGNGPQAIAFTPDGSQAWVANALDNTITVLDTATYRPVPASPVAVGGSPVAIVFTPDGSQAWVVNYTGGTVTALDTSTYKPVAASPLVIGDYPTGIALTPDGRQAWVCYGSVQVAVLDTATYQPVAASPLLVSVGIVRIAITPDGSQAWVTNEYSNNVTVLDTATYQPVAGSPIPVGEAPQALAFAPDGSQVWIVNTNGKSLSALAIKTYEAAPTT